MKQARLQSCGTIASIMITLVTANLHANMPPCFSESRCLRINGPTFRAPSWPAPYLTDWNGDGLTDLTLGGNAGPIWVYIRNPDSTFEPPYALQANRQNIICHDLGVAVADWNNDGLPDLILTKATQVTLYINTGSVGKPLFDNAEIEGFGKFKQGSEITAGGEKIIWPNPLGGADFADWNGDGLPDLFVAEKKGRVWWCRNLGKPGRPLLATPELLDARGQSILGDQHFASPTLGDIDGDGRNDLVVASYYKGARIYLTRGEPGKPELVPFNSDQTLLSGYRPLMHLGDWDGDGRPDLISGETSTLMVALNKTEPLSPGTQTEVEVKFDPPQRIQGRDFAYRSFLTVAFTDLDGDGLPDIMAGSYNRSLHFYINQGTPGSPAFTAPDIFVNRLAMSTREMGMRKTEGTLRCSQPWPCDWNNDGVCDLIFGAQNGSVIVMQNFGTKTQLEFDMRRQKGFNAMLLYKDEAGWTIPAMADLDQDGVADLLVGNAAGEILFMRNSGQTHWMVMDNPRPLTLNGQPVRVQGTAAPYPYDWNGDNIIDLLVGTGDGEIRILAGTKKPTDFTDLGTINGDKGPIKIRHRSRPWIMDWNEDGVPDLLVISPEDELRCYLGAMGK